MRKELTLFFALLASYGYAQKKPLDHNVYDTWEAVGAKQFSNDGNFAAYTINQQEGDGILYIHNTFSPQKLAISRGQLGGGMGGNTIFSPDSKFAAITIKPWYADSRLVRIKKKKAEELDKDTLGIVNLTNLVVTKIPRVKSYKFPEAGKSWLAYLKDKDQAPANGNNANPNGTAGAAGTPGAPGNAGARGGAPGAGGRGPAAGSGGGSGANAEGTDLILKNLTTGVEKTFKFVKDYYFSKDGKLLVYTSSGDTKQKNAGQGVYLYHTETGLTKTLVKGKGNFKSFTFDEESEKLVFVGETSPEKEEIKDFSIYYSSLSLDTAQILIDNQMEGLAKGYVVNGDGRINFSKDGDKLFLSVGPKPTPKDTTIIESEVAKLDIWGYKDDYLQTQQLRSAGRDSRKSYLSVFDIYSANPKIVQLADEEVENVTQLNEGNSPYLLGSSDKAYRIASQWLGGSARDYYIVDMATGNKKQFLKEHYGSASASPQGNYVLIYNKKDKSYSTYHIATNTFTKLNEGMNVNFFNEENDVPDDPNSYGVAGWSEDDKLVYIYDKFDIWAFSPDGKTTPKNITNGFGRANNITFRVERVGNDRFFGKKEVVYLDAFNNSTKENGFYKKSLGDNKNPELIVMAPVRYSTLTKAKNAQMFMYDAGSYVASPDVYISKDLKTATKLSNTNPQQANYNWGTAELVKWTTPKGYKSEGILYKPEDFDPNKKYPMIVYFYEKLSDGLHTYNAPSPTPSRLNIPFFVSNGYLVFAPDISYEIGYPGKSAEEFINSGVNYLKQNAWVDGSKIGIQGQSWGGYQVAHLITVNDMYAAAWAGAPVVNMTSAYGGIRWESGMNRQFQYEKTQSRIGATLWEKPELYIENSPLFHFPKVNTPVVVMANDADGAVPWYQGIEMFTGLRRLGKPVWMLNYNNEAHNLVQRQNRKDIQIREQQFFDHYLKGAKAPVWMTKGVPATEKGKTWGFELTDDKP
ncbi:MAG: S9 family peptidase [Pedobacter sp.]|nr:MAG: S9 family peptidase [Pedobacter sp.]